MHMHTMPVYFILLSSDQRLRDVDKLHKITAVTVAPTSNTKHDIEHLNVASQ